MESLPVQRCEDMNQASGYCDHPGEDTANHANHDYNKTEGSDIIPWRELQECCKDYKKPRTSKVLKIKFGFKVPHILRKIVFDAEKQIDTNSKGHPNLKRSKSLHCASPPSKKAKHENNGKKQKKITNFLKNKPGKNASKKLHRSVSKLMENMMNRVCEESKAQGEGSTEPTITKDGKKVRSKPRSKPKKPSQQIARGIVTGIINKACKQIQKNEAQPAVLNSHSAQSRNTQTPMRGKPKKGVSVTPSQQKNLDKIVGNLLDSMCKKVSAEIEKEKAKKQKMKDKANAVRAKAEKRKQERAEFLIKASKGETQNILQLLMGKGYTIAKSSQAQKRQTLIVLPAPAPQNQVLTKSPDLAPFQKLLSGTRPAESSPTTDAKPSCSQASSNV